MTLLQQGKKEDDKKYPAGTTLGFGPPTEPLSIKAEIINRLAGLTDNSLMKKFIINFYQPVIERTKQS